MTNAVYSCLIRKYSASPAPAIQGPLSKITFAVKDNITIKGQPLSLGLFPAPIEASNAQATIVSSLELAGAICIASTNMDELGTEMLGKNRHYGDVINPINSQHLALGSSSGSAVATQLEYCDFALGTDFGGSVRAPAAACGIYGLKFSSSNPSKAGVFDLSPQMDSLGILCKTSCLILKICEALGLLSSSSETKMLLIPQAQDLAFISLEYARFFNELINNLRRHFEIMEAPFIYTEASKARKVLAVRDAAKALEQIIEYKKYFPASALAILEKAKQLTQTQILEAKSKRFEYIKLSQTCLKNALLISPTLTQPTPTKSLPQNLTNLNLFLELANLIDCPALSIPIEQYQHEGLPFAVQISSLFHDLRNLLNFQVTGQLLP